MCGTRARVLGCSEQVDVSEAPDKVHQTHTPHCLSRVAMPLRIGVSAATIGIAATTTQYKVQGRYGKARQWSSELHGGSASGAVEHCGSISKQLGHVLLPPATALQSCNCTVSPLSCFKWSTKVPTVWTWPARYITWGASTWSKAMARKLQATCAKGRRWLQGLPSEASAVVVQW